MGNELTIKKLQNKLLLIFCILVSAIAMILSYLYLNRASVAMRNNAINLISANTDQIQLNINSYFDRVEGTVALLFSDENYYGYDETSGKYDDYTKLQYEEAIKNKIVDLGIMDNYADFGIVYSDDYTVGWISNTTKSLYKEEGLYNSAVVNITNDKKSNGWYYNIGGDLDRIYYVKRINDNAVVVSSFYSRELERVFKVPDELEGITVRLVDKENRILYSSKKEEVGTTVKDKMADALSQGEETVYTNDSIIDINYCENGWRVVSEVPGNVYLSDLASLKQFAFSMSLIMVSLFIIAGVSLLRKLASPVDVIMTDLEKKASLDGLSGVLNKKAFENTVTEEFNVTITGCSITFVVMDVDHFKSINDNLGHEYGDQFIVKTSKFLKEHLPESTIIGRVGGDEFSFMLKGADKSEQAMEEYSTEIISVLVEEYVKEFKEEHEKYDVSLSIGAYTFEYHGENFKDIYKKTDTALYKSKEAGRNRYTFFKEDSN